MPLDDLLSESRDAGKPGKQPLDQFYQMADP